MSDHSEVLGSTNMVKWSAVIIEGKNEKLPAEKLMTVCMGV